MFLSQNRQPAFSRGIPFVISHDSYYMSRAYSQKGILVNLELDCTPKFECDGARIADATTSSVN
jgi:hypothetical protein